MVSERSKKRSADTADENPFMVKQQKKTDERDSRRGLKTSEEIAIYDVGDAPVIDYGRNDSKREVDHSKDSKVIEFSADTIEYVDISKAKTVEINGKREREDLKKKVKADFKALSKVKVDPEKSHQDIRRNIDEYKPLCRACRGSMECRECGGKGKKGLFFKCKECDGTGMCMKCGDLGDVECPSCKKSISVLSTSCKFCGAAFNCPDCYNPLPATATRCIRCRTEFFCQRCKGVISPGMDKRCPSCGTEHWHGVQKRELPIRKDAK